MRFYFARMQSDGRLSAPIFPGYPTKEDAKKDAMKLLRLRGSARMILVEVVETIEVTAAIKFLAHK